MHYATELLKSRSSSARTRSGSSRTAGADPRQGLMHTGGIVDEELGADNAIRRWCRREARATRSTFRRRRLRRAAVGRRASGLCREGRPDAVVLRSQDKTLTGRGLSKTPTRSGCIRTSFSTPWWSRRPGGHGGQDGHDGVHTAAPDEGDGGSQDLLRWHRAQRGRSDRRLLVRRDGMDPTRIERIRCRAWSNRPHSSPRDLRSGSSRSCSSAREDPLVQAQRGRRRFARAASVLAHAHLPGRERDARVRGRAHRHRLCRRPCPAQLRPLRRPPRLFQRGHPASHRLGVDDARQIFLHVQNQIVQARVNFGDMVGSIAAQSIGNRRRR